MKLRNLIVTAAASGLIALPLAGAAMADSVTIDNTGPSSTNTTTITNNDTFTSTNTNNVTVTNTNSQTATSGAANVSGNTNAGSATSGNASNTNTTSTTISVNNTAGGIGGGTLGGVGGGTLGTGGGSVSAASTGGGVGGGTLPVTGATSPIDVSALQNTLGLHADAARTASQWSALLLALAAVLSLGGALGSAVYAHRRAV